MTSQFLNSIGTKLEQHSFSPCRIPYNVSQMGDESKENDQMGVILKTLSERNSW